MPADEFKMPEVHVGDVVLWYEGGITGARAAVVAKVGQHTVALNVVDPNTYNFLLRDGVRHKDDPRAKDAEVREGGTWGHSRLVERLMALEKALS